MRRALILIFVLIVLPAIASAQVPAGNVFFGYSYGSVTLNHGSSTSLNGWNGSLEGKMAPFVSIVADLSGYYGATNNFPTSTNTMIRVGASEYNFLFGPRVSFSVKRFRPFAHALVGAGHERVSGSGYSASDTGLAFALGGGLDYRLWHLIGWRFQGDYLQTRFFGNTQKDGRFSTGLVLHF